MEGMMSFDSKTLQTYMFLLSRGRTGNYVAVLLSSFRIDFEQEFRCRSHRWPLCKEFWTPETSYTSWIFKIWWHTKKTQNTEALRLLEPILRSGHMRDFCCSQLTLANINKAAFILDHLSFLHFIWEFVSVLHSLFFLQFAYIETFCLLYYGNYNVVSLRSQWSL